MNDRGSRESLTYHLDTPQHEHFSTLRETEWFFLSVEMHIQKHQRRGYIKQFQVISQQKFLVYLRARVWEPRNVIRNN